MFRGREPQSPRTNIRIEFIETKLSRKTIIKNWEFIMIF